MRPGLSGYLAGFIVAVTASRSLQAEPMWTIGTFNDSNWEFDHVPHDDPVNVRFRIGDPVETFPAGVGTDIGPQRSIIDISFSGFLDSPSDLSFRWSPGNTSLEQFSISLGVLPGDQFIPDFTTNSEAREGEDEARWTTDKFRLPAVPGYEHTLRLTHLSGDGTWNDALELELIPEPSTTVSLASLGLLCLMSCGYRRWRNSVRR